MLTFDLCELIIAALSCIACIGGSITVPCSGGGIPFAAGGMRVECPVPIAGTIRRFTHLKPYGRK